MKYIIKNIFINIYILLIFFIILSPFSKNYYITKYAIAICLYLLIKWISNYNKCTISYIECKIRNVKKEDGYLYNFLNNIMMINTMDSRYYIYSGTFIILFLNLIKYHLILSDEYSI
jgi:hypothetical protein